ncbi:MAG: tetratricopeptide repeat protein [Dysosmobacter sp.]
MKEINAAYEEITKIRGSGGHGSGSAVETAGGYSGSATMAVTYRQYGGSSVLQQVRIAIQTGNLSRAEALLANYSDHNAEWNFLRGAVCYRRGWMDEAKRYYETACQMDPGNPEYRQALEFMQSGAQRAYRSGNGTHFGTDLCGGNLCLTLCCLYSLCHGGGYVLLLSRWGGRKYD